MKGKTHTWKWLLLAALLMIGLAIPSATTWAATAPAAASYDGHEDGDESVADDSAAIEDLFLFLVLVETSSVEMDNMLIALDQLRAGETYESCSTIVDTAFWMPFVAFALTDPTITPSGYEDIAAGVIDGLVTASDAVKDVALVCRNGVADQLGDFQHGYARAGVVSARDIIKTKSEEAAARSGVVAPADPTLLAFIVELFQPPAGPFTTGIFRADVEITLQTLQYMAGWIDRANAGHTVYCLEYLYYYVLLSPAEFASVPAEYQALVNEHRQVIDQVKDTSRSLIDFCVSLVDNPNQDVPQFTLDSARFGLAQAHDRAYNVLQQIPE